MQLRARLQGMGEMFRKIDLQQAGLILVGSLLALLVRIPLLEFKSADYDTFTKVWYNTLQSLGYIALRGDFSNYNPPYLYLLYLVVRFLPNMDKVAAIKVPSIIMDFVCAAFVYKIIALKSRNKLVPLLGYMATLLAPVVILNSSFWGQADSIYTAGLLGCVYFLLVKKNWLALISFGLAFVFKLQAIFLLPLLIILWLRHELSWKHFLAIPVVYFLAILPAWIIGRPLGSLLTVYATQADYYNKLTSHAPNLYAWFPTGQDVYQLLYPAGLAFGGTVLLILVLVAAKGTAKLSVPLLVELAAFSTLLAPFVLPKMHQRYFFPADILSIAFSFYFPAYFYVALVINMVSFFSYQYFLFGPETVPMPILALVMLLIIAIMTRHLLLQLYACESEPQPKGERPAINPS
jgi:Gpi18-like mannosyltransferase